MALRVFRKSKCAVYDPIPDFIDEPDLFRQWNDSVRRNHPIKRAVPTNQSFIPFYPFLCDVVQWLIVQHEFIIVISQTQLFFHDPNGVGVELNYPPDERGT